MKLGRSPRHRDLGPLHALQIGCECSSSAIKLAHSVCRKTTSHKLKYMPKVHANMLAATQAAKDKSQNKIKGYVYLDDDQLLYEARHDSGALLAPIVIEFIGRKFGMAYKNKLLDHDMHHMRAHNVDNASNEASAIYQISLLGLQGAITKDGFEPYSLKNMRDIAQNSSAMDAFLLTTLAAADKVFEQASQRLTTEIRDQIWQLKHAGKHEQACGVACKALDVQYMDTFDRKKFYQWWEKALDQVYTDQEAFTIFTYGNIGQDPPTLHDDKTKVPPPPPPTKKESPLTKLGCTSTPITTQSHRSDSFNRRLAK